MNDVKQAEDSIRVQRMSQHSRSAHWILNYRAVKSVECWTFGVLRRWYISMLTAPLWRLSVWYERMRGRFSRESAFCLCLFMILKHKWSISADVPLTVTPSQETPVITRDSGKVVDITCKSEQHNPNQLIICWVAVARLVLYAVFLFVYLLLDIFTVWQAYGMCFCQVIACKILVKGDICHG